VAWAFTGLSSEPFTQCHSTRSFHAPLCAVRLGCPGLPRASRRRPPPGRGRRPRRPARDRRWVQDRGWHPVSGPAEYLTPVAHGQGQRWPLGCSVKLSPSGPGNFHDFMPERGSAPDAGDALRRACRGPWNCHLLMGRRTQCRRPGRYATPRRPPPGCSGGFCPALRAAMTSAPEHEISTSIFMTGLLLDRFSHESYGRLSSVHPSCDCEAGQPMPVINCEPGGRHFARHPVGAARRSTRAADDGCAHPSWRCMS